MWGQKLDLFSSTEFNFTVYARLTIVGIETNF